MDVYTLIKMLEQYESDDAVVVYVREWGTTVDINAINYDRDVHTIELEV